MMKRVTIIILLLILCISGYAKDSTRVFKVGIIPYQFLSRSTGAYVGYDFKHFSLEYRPTYTIATHYINSYATDDNTLFYYQGLNNNILISLPISAGWKLGLLLGYRYWWFNPQRVIANGYATWESNPPKETESGNKQGFCYGLELSKDLGANKTDAVFFFNISCTSFMGTLKVYPNPWQSIPSAPPMNYSFSETRFNVAIGFKIGYRSPRK